MKRCNQEQLLNLKAVYDEDVLKKSKKVVNCCMKYIRIEKNLELKI